MLVIEGATVKRTALLAARPTITVNDPVVAAAGTVTVMLVSDQPEGVAGTPFIFTELPP
jgi:hypothetical protein